MEKLINIYKEKLNNEKDDLNNLIRVTRELENTANKLRKNCFIVIGASFGLHCLGYLLMNSPIVIISLLMLLGIAPFGFRIINLDGQVDDNNKKIAEMENNIIEYENEIERLYSRKEVLDLIKNNVHEISHEPIIIGEKTNTKNNINSR